MINVDILKTNNSMNNFNCSDKNIDEKVSDSKISSIYDKQLILNLGRGYSSECLAIRAKKKNLSNENINLHHYQPFWKEALRPMFSVLTHDTRVYLIGHCGPGANYLCTIDGSTKMSVDDYVSLFEMAIALKETPLNKPIKISIIGCYSSVDQDERKSFGHCLSRALKEAGILARVIGRVGLVGCYFDTSLGNHKKYIDGNYHKDRSKVGRSGNG